MEATQRAARRSGLRLVYSDGRMLGGVGEANGEEIPRTLTGDEAEGRLMRHAQDLLRDVDRTSPFYEELASLVARLERRGASPD